MNTRHALVGAAVVGLLLGGVGVAAATPGETGPDSKACRNATIAHGEALAAHLDAEKAENKATKAAKDPASDGGTAITDKEQVGIDVLHDKVLGLAEKLDEAKAKLKDKCTKPADPKPADPPAVDDDDDDKPAVFVIEREVERQVEVVPDTSDGVETGGL